MVAAILGACSANPTPAPTPRNRIAIVSAKHAATLALEGLELFRYDVHNIYAPDRWFLRSWIDRKSGEVTHQLYYEDHYRNDAWRGWHAASDEDAKPLKFVPIARHVVSCTDLGPCVKEEIFGASIDDDFLRDHARAGFSVQFVAENGERQVVRVSARQVSSQITEIEAIRRDPAAY